MCLGADKFDTKEIDLTKGEHKAEAYLKINPAGAVPALTKQVKKKYVKKLTKLTVV